MRDPLFDLRGATDEDIAAFVFDHPVTEPTCAWWWDSEDAEVRTDPREMVGFLARLMAHPEPLRERWSPAQIDQGFWLMFGAAMEQDFADSLWNRAVPWEERRACILTLPELYARLFAPTVAGLDDYFASAMYMLPDFLAFGYDREKRTRADEDERRVQDALLEAFEGMLRSHDGGTWMAALHGLGHLRHPDGPDVIRAFLAAHPPLSDELRTYAERAIAGNVL